MVRWLISWTCFCQALLDLPVALRYAASGFDAPNAKKSAIGTTSRPLKIRKLLRYGIYTPEIWRCYCDVTILYSGHSEHSQTYAAAIIQAKFNVSTTHVKRETVGAFCTWKLERLQVHHGIGKLEHLLSNVHLQSMSLLNFMAGELECTLFKECFFGGRRVGLPLLMVLTREPLQEHAEHLQELVNEGKLDGAAWCEEGAWFELFHWSIGPFTHRFESVHMFFVIFFSQPARDFFCHIGSKDSKIIQNPRICNKMGSQLSWYNMIRYDKKCELHKYCIASKQENFGGDSSVPKELAETFLADPGAKFGDLKGG